METASPLAPKVADAIVGRISLSLSEVIPVSMDTTTDRLITVSELAHWLQWSEWSIYQAVQHGKIPHVRLGRTIRFQVDGIRQWLDSAIRVDESGDQ